MKKISKEIPLTSKELEAVAISGNWTNVDISKIPLELINNVIYILEKRSSNLIGLAAQAGKLDKFPRELITSERLNRQNAMGENAIHFAAESCQIKYIPKELLNKENISTPNHEGTTPIHYSVLYRSLDQFPKELLSPQLLKQKNKGKLSAFDYGIFTVSAMSQGFDTERSLKERKEAIDQIRFISSKLDTKTLQKYLKEKVMAKDLQTLRNSYINQELKKRKILKEIAKETNSIEI